MGCFSVKITSVVLAPSNNNNVESEKAMDEVVGTFEGENGDGDYESTMYSQF